MQRLSFAAYTWGCLIINLLVILWGAYVRISNSGDGCGNHWPLCYGEFIPRVSHTATWIEFVHRATSGIAFFFIVGLLLWALRVYPRSHHVRKGALFAMSFMLIEVLVGAALVLFGLVADNVSVARALVITIHQANTLFLIGALTLTAWWASGGSPLQPRESGSVMRWLIPGLIGALLLGMTGAITALADTLFPAPSLQAGIAQDFDPNAHFLIQLRIFHPIIAISLGAYLFVAVWKVRKQRADSAVQTFSSVLFVLFIMQIVVGSLNIISQPLWSRLSHLFLADLVWIMLVLLSAVAIGRPSEHALLQPTLSQVAP